MALQTADALPLTGVTRSVWNDMLARGYYTEAPPTTQGVPREFVRDDLVALTILKVLLDSQVRPSFAGAVASQIRAKLRRNENIDELFLAVVTDKKGKTHPKVVDRMPNDGLHPFVFRIAVYRRQAETDIAAWQEADEG